MVIPPSGSLRVRWHEPAEYTACRAWALRAWARARVGRGLPPPYDLDVTPCCYGRLMGRLAAVMACSGCGWPAARWSGRCPACGEWGTIEERPAIRSRRPKGPAGGAPGASVPVPVLSLRAAEGGGHRVATGFPGIDRVLGGGLVPASVVLLAGEPGIGKSTLLLQLVANLSAAGLTCLMASGEESRDQVADRAARLGVEGGSVSFVSGRDLADVLETALDQRPSLLAVDSIQTLRDPDASGTPGSPAQVRSCADALVGLAKSQGIAVLATGHVTKDGGLAGPRTLEHAVDVVLSFEGDPRSGLRALCGGKNRFGQEGETAWFEMGRTGLAEIDPGGRLAPGGGEAGAATALPLAGRRAFAVEVQALSVETQGPPRRQVSGLDARRFSLVAAVVERAMNLRLARLELYGATAGGLRVDDPGIDLAVAAALASAVTGVPPPPRSAFVGEVSLTGQVRPVAGLGQRLAAARSRGISLVFAPPDDSSAAKDRSVRVMGVRTVAEAAAWCIAKAGRRNRRVEPGEHGAAEEVADMAI
jgi:DNA repair protein RadA/Sms